MAPRGRQKGEVKRIPSPRAQPPWPAGYRLQGCLRPRPCHHRRVMTAVKKENTNDVSF